MVPLKREICICLFSYWHNSNSEVRLHEYLGMTEEEYAFWMEDERNLEAILESRTFELGLGL